MQPIIQIENVSFSYSEDKRKALDGVSLAIAPGSFTAVLGSNGSGKSTLAKHLNAILLPSEGRVLVDGLDTREENNLIGIRRRVGMVFQNPDNQIVANVVEGARKSKRRWRPSSACRPLRSTTRTRRRWVSVLPGVAKALTTC